MTGLLRIPSGTGEATGADPRWAAHRALLARTRMGQQLTGRDGRPGWVVLIDATNVEKMRILIEQPRGLAELVAGGEPLRWM